MKRIDSIKSVFYQKGEEGNILVSKIIALSHTEVVPFNDEKELTLLLEEARDKGLTAKEVLVLKPFKGRLFQKCPGSPNMICCNYLLINTCFGCFYNCTYCFLLSYLNTFGIVQFTNMADIAEEIREQIDPGADRVYRIGTGEFTDSLMMDRETGIAKHIIKLFNDYPNVMVEFKTKSCNIDHLLDIAEKGNTVLAWTLNTDKNITEYEGDTASLDERLRAARMAGEAGYYLAFHFDPIIRYNGFMDDYFTVIDRLFASVPGDKIAWISMGGFRYTPGFKETMRDHFPRERLTLEEMVQGADGKYRYYKKMRVDIYRQLKEKLESYNANPFIYMCMETGDVWQQVFGRDYHVSEDLERDFSEHLKRFFLCNKSDN